MLKINTKLLLEKMKSFQMEPITVSVIMTASPLEAAVSNTLAHPGEGQLLAPASQHCLGAPAMAHHLNA